MPMGPEARDAVRPHRSYPPDLSCNPLVLALAFVVAVAYLAAVEVANALQNAWKWIRRGLGIAVLVVALISLISGTAWADAARRALVQSLLSASVTLYTAPMDKDDETKGVFCSGTFAAADLVLTAYHCVPVLDEQRTFVRIASGRMVRVAGFAARSKPLDLALLRLSEPVAESRIPPLAGDVVVGDRVFVVGAPDGTPLFVSEGIVAKVYEDAEFASCPGEAAASGTGKQQVLFIDARTWFGSSGGGVFDESGRLVGVETHIHLGGYTCGMQAAASWLPPLWGDAVGVKTVSLFLQAALPSP